MAIAHIVITFEDGQTDTAGQALRLSYSGVNDLKSEQAKAAFYLTLDAVVNALSEPDKTVADG